MMKLRKPTNELRKQTTSRQRTKKSIKLILLATVFTFTTFASTAVRADTYDEQINQLNAENNSLRSQTSSLATEAESLEAAISALQAQISALEAQIRENTAKKARIEAEIARTETELNVQRDLLGKNIRMMYLEGDISTIEMLASSKDLSEFVDKEQYRTTIQNEIKKTLDKIAALRAEQEAQKASLEQLLKDQQNIQGQLSTQKAEQARLLSLNRQQRNELNGEIQANSTKIAELRRQQAAENARVIGGSVQVSSDGTGYPWAGVRFPNSMPDPWGMYKRQCVSYTAWRVAASGRHMPYWGGRGNAKLWDDNARAAGIPVDRNPRVGDVAVSNSGYYGHVMYVEKVYGDGTIYISQYNAGWGGRYSEARIPVGNLWFIHF